MASPQQGDPRLSGSPTGAPVTGFEPATKEILQISGCVPYHNATNAPATKAEQFAVQIVTRQRYRQIVTQIRKLHLSDVTQTALSPDCNETAISPRCNTGSGIPRWQQSELFLQIVTHTDHTALSPHCNKTALSPDCNTDISDSFISRF
ncbi:hypothetical protein PoB_004800000 [Plakobranchus ocellatus]|uniref:Uncharacterized protein n=1 Tax=Plakobranchus ocellatus TaxID=259542 RepID=A0AAV4BQW3_9GAST|nr:hypothetical protein PoB_004800000 [Plakobranchus ocellatus]